MTIRDTVPVSGLSLRCFIYLAASMVAFGWGQALFAQQIGTTTAIQLPVSASVPAVGAVACWDGSSTGKATACSSTASSVIGVVQALSLGSAVASIVQSGPAQCTFASPPPAAVNDYVTVNTSGQCVDNGTTYPTGPAVGIVSSTSSMGGLYTISVFTILTSQGAITLTTPGRLTISSANPTSSLASGALVVGTGNTTSAASGAIQIQSGNAATSGSSGNVSVDAGSASSTPGQVQIGPVNASAVLIGHNMAPGGTAAMTIPNSGYVGIGTSTASNHLVIGSDTIGATGAPASSVAIGSTSTNSVVTVGQDPTNRAFFGWNYNVTPANAYITLGAISTQSLELQPYGGKVGIGTATPAHTLDIQGTASVNGGIIVKHLGPLTGYTITANDFIVGCNTAANVAIILPDATTLTAMGAAQVFIVTDETGGMSMHPITISTVSGQTINGAASYIINTPFGSARIYSDSANWHTW